MLYLVNRDRSFHGSQFLMRRIRNPRTVDALNRPIGHPRLTYVTAEYNDFSDCQITIHEQTVNAKAFSGIKTPLL